MQLPMALLGPIDFLKAAANELGWVHFYAYMQLPMALHGPIIFLEAAANALA